MVGMMKQYDPGYQRGVQLVQRLHDLRYVEATTLEPEGTLYHAHHPIVRSGAPRQPQQERYGAEMFNSIQQGILASQPLDQSEHFLGVRLPNYLQQRGLSGNVGQPTEVSHLVRHILQ